MSDDLKEPISLVFKSFQTEPKYKAATDKEGFQSLQTLESYSFVRSIITPASAFRFSAPGIDKATRLAIRSGDLVEIHATNSKGTDYKISTGFLDETDTHIVPNMVTYTLTGRDTMSVLVDNATVDKDNRVIQTTNISLIGILKKLIENTRLPKEIGTQQIPNGSLLFQTHPNETKISTMQRYLEFTNCLLWSDPQGRLVLGKPNFTQDPMGTIISRESDPSLNNTLDVRVRRNVNGAIRNIVTQLQTLNNVSPAPYTMVNQDKDMQATKPGVGRSVYRAFSYGQGEDAVNQIQNVGNQTGTPRNIGNELSARELARDNMKILDVEAVVEGHFNANGTPYNIDQVYNVIVEDEDIEEPMYLYHVEYSLTKEAGMITHLRFCRLWTIVAYVNELKQVVQQ